MIIIEAYARKTPVIVRDLGPFPEAIEESGACLVLGSKLGSPAISQGTH
jgi:hypothetical protein